MICIICNENKGTSFFVAKKLEGHILFAKNKPDISCFSFVVLICANTGDEELQSYMEDFLLSLKDKHKKYAICELGNYFGFERDCFGCKTIVRKILENLEWEEVSDVSVDALPALNVQALDKWIGEINEFIKNDRN